MSSDEVTVVVPARDAAATLGVCLDSLAPRVGGELREILVVDDGSTDGTDRVAARYPVVRLRGPGRGAGAARNVGWRRATTPLVWFIDADCVAESDALALLLPHLAEPAVAGVGGSYANRREDSLLARLIHEEIALRHRRSPREVDYLASFNVLYRRSALAAMDGFDETCTSASTEDMELAYRLTEAGYSLRFEPDSRVGHFHEHRLSRYLRTQARHGYWRVQVYRRHPRRMAGDAYSGLTDHVQPPLALLFAAALPFSLRPWGTALVAALAAALVGAALPMTVCLWRRTGRTETLLFALLAPLRALARGVGALLGVSAVGASALRRSPPSSDAFRKDSA